MDSSLHCNDLKCRKALNDQAVVTTCSHVFCLPCADRLELTTPKDGQRKCPACQTYLLNPDDAVVTSLNPSEDYKTSILSGLSPTVIIECASRGLQFWTYQMAQEVTYQDYLARSLKEKYSVLGAHLDNVVREATEENNKLIARIDELQAREQHLHGRIQNFEVQWKEKDKAFRKMENMYAKAKANMLAGGIEQAAEQDADQVLQGSTQYHPSQPQGLGRRPQRSDSRSSGDHVEGHARPRNMSSQYLSQGVATQGHRMPGSSPDTMPIPTPSGQHRQQLPVPAYGTYNSTLIDPLRREPMQATPRTHKIPRTITGPGWATHGLGNNARTRRPAAPTFSHTGIPGSSQRYSYR